MHKSHTDIWEISNMEMIDQGREILASAIQNNDSQPLTLAKMAYQACTKTALQDDRYPELDIVAQFGGMPILGAPDFNFGWEQIAAMSVAFDTPILFNHVLVSYSEHPNRDYDIEISISRSMYHFSVSAYKALLDSKGIEDVIMLFRAICVRLISQMGPMKLLLLRSLNRSLSQVQTFMEQLRDIKERNPGFPFPMQPLKQRFTLADLQNWSRLHFGPFVKIKWSAYLQIVYPNIYLSECANVNLVFQRMNLKSLYNIIQLVEVTDSNVLKNYALLKIFYRMAYDSDYTVRQLMEVFQLQHGGTTMSRYEYCTNMVLDIHEKSIGLSLALIPLFQEPKHLKLLDLAKTIALQLQNTFKDVIMLQWYWMDELSRYKSAQKVLHMQMKLGYPQVPTESFLINFYRQLTISHSDHFANARALNVFRNINHFRLLFDMQTWPFSPFIIASFYYYYRNSLDIPIAMALYHLNTNNTNLIHLSRFGSIVGHEMSHAFDRAGRRRDYSGSTSLKLWSEQTMTKFMHIENCLIAQYSQYLDPAKNVMINGENTFDENFADNMGLAISYASFIANPERSFKVERYSEKQLFFLSFATLWCRITTNKTTHWSPLYAPFHVRVNVALSNFPEFSEVFHCEKGTGMNPYRQCHINHVKETII